MPLVMQAALINLVTLDHTTDKTFAAVAAGGIVLMMKFFRQNEQVDKQLPLLACLSELAFLSSIAAVRRLVRTGN
jgi:hypothetical protein